MHRPDPRGVALLAGVLALTSSPVRAAPSQEVRAEYELGAAARDSGQFAEAAEHFDAAYRTLPAESDVRSAVLFDLVDARRNAFAGGEGPPQLCESERLLVGYLDEVKARLGAKAERQPDARKAKKVLASVRQQIAALKRERPTLDCAAETLEAPRAPVPEEPDAAPLEAPATAETKAAHAQPPRPAGRPLVIAGATTLGVSGLFLLASAAGLGVGAAAERDGEALTSAALAAGAPLSEGDPELAALVRRGRLGNGFAAAGAALAGAALVAGIALLAVGVRRGRGHRAGLTPGPGLAGVGVALRF